MKKLKKVKLFLTQLPIIDFKIKIFKKKRKFKSNPTKLGAQNPEFIINIQIWQFSGRTEKPNATNTEK